MDAGSSKETSCRRSCREGNRPQPLEVASLLKLAATNVLFPCVHEGTAAGWQQVSKRDETCKIPAIVAAQRSESQVLCPR